MQPSKWHLLQWPLVWCAAVASIGFGISGFLHIKSQTFGDFLDAAYGSLQLFVLAGPQAGPFHWHLEIARFLAPAVTAYTAAMALLVLFNEHLRLFRLQFFRNHVVICGLGRLGFKLASDSLQRGRKVVVIELDEDNDWIPLCEAMGGIVLRGDASEEALLSQARVHEASHLIGTCPEDGTNVEIAINARDLIQSLPAKSEELVTCHVHIVDDDLRALFKHHQVFTDTGDRLQVRLFNVYDSSARLLLEQHPLDRELLSPDDPRTVQLVLVGLGRMGESVVIQAARIGHFSNHNHRLRITILDQDAQRREKSFRRRNPYIDRVCDMKFVQVDADDPDMLEQVTRQCSEKLALTTTVVCFDDDSHCLKFALSLLPRVKKLRTPILVRMATDEGLTSLLEAGTTAGRLGGLVHPFPVLPVWSERGTLLEPQADALAIAIHDWNRSTEAKLGTSPSTGPALPEWDELDEDLKDSCRHQADHIPVKLRALGCEMTRETLENSVKAFSPGQLEILARMEHSRWTAEKMLNGWIFAEGKKDSEHKTTPHLIQWNNLARERKERYRQIVERIPKLLESSGIRIRFKT